MRKRKTPAGDVSDPILARVMEVVGERSTTDVANSTGFNLASVHRYLHGSRIPADFCAAFASAYDVNPAWLLSGEGKRYLSDVPEETERMAGNVLELVEAMNAVMHMRLGALTGKHHLRVLRELNDALLRYEDLRERLNEHTRPIFRRTLDDLRRALLRRDVDRAAGLRKAVDQVARLCDDDELEREHLSLQALNEFLLLNRQRALEFQQKLFLHPLAHGRIVSEESATDVLRLVITMNETGREEEAGRLAEAALVLAGPEGENWSGIGHLAAVSASVLIARGDLMAAQARLQRFLPRLRDEPGRRAGQYWLQATQILAGVVTPREAIGMGEADESRLSQILRYALLLEDADLTEEVMAALRAPNLPRWEHLRHLLYVVEYGGALLTLLHGRRSEAGKQWQQFVKMRKESPDGLDVDFRILEAQFERLRGRAKKALAALGAVDELLKAPERRVGLPLRALHHRNALQTSGAPEEMRLRARLFFEEHIAKGYEFFRGQLAAPV